MADNHVLFFWEVLKWILGIGGSLLVIGFGIILWVLRDYAMQFRDTLEVLFQRFKDLDTERITAWRHQDDFCRTCFALVSRSIEIVRRRNEDDK
jgi:hypothetical protein